MIDSPSLCLLCGETKDDVDRQKKYWLAFNANDPSAIQFIDISDMSVDQAAAAVVKTIHQLHANRVMIESLSAIVDHAMDAVKIASAVLDAGARLFVVSYAVGAAGLIEIDQNLLQSVASGLIIENVDDLLFIANYGNQPLTMEHLLYHLTSLQEALVSRPEEVPQHLISADIRRIILLVRMMQKQPYNKISPN
jgi:hypothetical protein